MRTRILDAQSPAWASLVAQSGQLIGGPGFRPVKRTARTVAGFIIAGGRRVFVKRVDEGSLLKGWILGVRGSRAWRVLRGARILKAAGFAHPQPLAAAEARRFGAVRASYVVSQALDGARIMSDVVLAGGRRNFRRRCEISGAVASEIRRLHDAGIYTLDLQETNVMLAEGNGAGWKIYFVDLEDFRRARVVPVQRRMLNLVHLDRTIGRFLPRTQRLRFFYNYLGARPGRDEARRALRQLLAIRDRAERRAHAHQWANAPTTARKGGGSTASESLSRARAVRD